MFRIENFMWNCLRDAFVLLEEKVHTVNFIKC